MHDTAHLKSHQRHHRQRHREHRRRYWCCSFETPPLSPENLSLSHSHPNSLSSSSCNKKIQVPSSNSPQSQHHKPHLARRILSPGRVSPISDHPVIPENTLQSRIVPKSPLQPAESEVGARDEDSLKKFDVRLNLKGRNGRSLILELGSEVLIANSLMFADLIANYRKNVTGLCRIEVPDVENLNVFRQTIELMFEDDLEKKLLKVGVFRAIDLLEVSAGIKFSRGVSSCLKYLEAVPWTEEEEEKLREMFPKLSIDDGTTTNILDRLCSLSLVDAEQTLAKRLILSITTGADANARNEMKSLVKGLLCKSSVCERGFLDLNKDDILSVCVSCLASLITLLEEASGTQKSAGKEKEKPLLERLSKQVDNINWLVDILLDHQMAEEFVVLWANQLDLLKMHENASAMVRYELSRVSATLFLAMGSRRLQCQSATRLGFLQIWFRPMLSDFGWLQRCKKGLDIKALEAAMGQALLTLPLNEQYPLFMDWFECFSKHGTECPNLSKSFHIWWRRSFLRGSETFAVESR